MSWRILSACGWERPNGGPPPEEQPKVSLVQQRSGVDGGFLLVHLIAEHLRASAQNRVILFATHQTAAHYVGACQKVGLHATNFIGSGQFHIVDVHAELYAQCGKLESSAPMVGNFGAQLLPLIRDRVHEVTPSSNTIVIVDDLGFYAIVDPTIGEDGVIDFVEELIGTSLAGIGHIVLKVNAAECYGRLCAFLTDLTTIDILLEPLSSGNFREVDGRLTVHERTAPEGSCLVLRNLRCNLLYKVGDRQVQTFVPGEFGIKNL
uniref:Elongator complex protein 6 n=1 Tax=Anopheles atroparvus TaxID=41427 RepID=A0A182IQI4_ANOAO